MKSISLCCVLLVLLAAVQSKILPAPRAAVKAECDNLQIGERFDCFPELGSNQQTCEARGCCWVPAARGTPQNPGPAPRDAPWCFYPKSYGGYEYINKTDTPNGQQAFLKRTFQSAYPNDVQTLRLDVEHQTNDRVRIKISDASNARYESPYPKNTTSITKAADNPNYQVDIDTNQSGFQVKRKDGSVIFNTQNVGALIFADQLLQISTTFQGHIYGLGEHRSNLWLDTNWSLFTMFNRDQPPRENANLYGSHPFYLVVQSDGTSYGVFLKNSNAMDVIVQPMPAVTFRTIGGILDFYIFLGPTPADVISQYTELIGRPFMPPYWSLGFQLCRYGYGSADNTRAVWQRTRDAQIPFDVQWNDIDYMINNNDFTIDPNNYGSLPQLVNDIHDSGMHYVPILDPGVSASEPAGSYPPYDDGVAMGIFVKNRDGSVFIGKTWNPTSTAYPDFTDPKTIDYWTKQVRELKEKISFDGLWIDMNEPSNFLDGGFDGCPESNLDSPPYVPTVTGDRLTSKTICMSAKQYAGDHYNVHNLYGISEAEVTYIALRNVTGKRGFVLSRSTFPGSGAYTGHWSGDDASNWYDLTKSVPEILVFSLYGIPYMGADICGFNGDSNHNLCNRWQQLGAFYPFSRNHNTMGTVEQDPVVWGQDVVDSAKKALNVRYTLLPYLYTLFYRARVYGETVSRPLFVEFPNDPNTMEVDRSFLWGSGLYIVPVTEDNADSVTAYLPAGRWYDWYTGFSRDSQGAETSLSAPFDTIPVLVRGGIVLPTQAPAVTTTLSRKNGFTIVAASDSNGAASGQLFWDDGESLDTIENSQYGLLNFALSGQTFTSEVVQWNTNDTPKLEAIKILGISGTVNQVTVNGSPGTFTVDANKVLTVSGLSIPLSTPIDLQWS